MKWQDKVLKAGLAIMERNNTNDYYGTPMQYTITGGVRNVEFYPTTGTVFANAVKGKFKMISLKQAGIATAIKICKEGHY